MTVRDLSRRRNDLVRILARVRLLTVERDARQRVRSLQAFYRDFRCYVARGGVGRIVFAVRITVVGVIQLIIRRDRQRRLRDNKFKLRRARINHKRRIIVARFHPAAGLGHQTVSARAQRTRIRARVRRSDLYDAAHAGVQKESVRHAADAELYGVRFCVILDLLLLALYRDRNRLRRDLQRAGSIGHFVVVAERQRILTRRIRVMTVRDLSRRRNDLVRILARVRLLTVERDARQRVRSLQAFYRDFRCYVARGGVGRIVFAVRITVVGVIQLIIRRDRQRRLRDNKFKLRRARINHKRRIIVARFHPAAGLGHQTVSARAQRTRIRARVRRSDLYDAAHAGVQKESVRHAADAELYGVRFCVILDLLLLALYRDRHGLRVDRQRAGDRRDRVVRRHVFRAVHDLVARLDRVVPRRRFGHVRHAAGRSRYKSVARQQTAARYSDRRVRVRVSVIGPRLACRRDRDRHARRRHRQLSVHRRHRVVVRVARGEGVARYLVRYRALARERDAADHNRADRIGAHQTGNVVTAVAVRVAVIREGFALRRHRHSLRVDRQLAGDVGDVIVVKYRLVRRVAKGHSCIRRNDLLRIHARVRLLAVERDARQRVRFRQAFYRDFR